MRESGSGMIFDGGRGCHRVGLLAGLRTLNPILNDDLSTPFLDPLVLRTRAKRRTRLDLSALLFTGSSSRVPALVVVSASALLGPER
jgi:hypothetical protein